MKINKMCCKDDKGSKDKEVDSVVEKKVEEVRKNE